MVSFDVSPALKVTASVLLLVALGMPSASFSQRIAKNRPLRRFRSEFEARRRGKGRIRRA